MEQRQYAVYILSSHTRTLYIGVTNNLQRRLYEHKNKLVPGFTAKYNVDRLVYYEMFTDARDAIAREKQLKNWARKKKEFLVETLNPEWRDLSENS